MRCESSFGGGDEGSLYQLLEVGGVLLGLGEAGLQLTLCHWAATCQHNNTELPERSYKSSVTI